MTSLKSYVKSLIPPAVFKVREAIRQGGIYGFFGDYETWEAAIAASSGWDSPAILEQVKASALKVKNGEAAYERDSVVFNEIEYSWPLLAALLRIAVLGKGHLRILDFGGSLGSSYYQNKSFLSALKSLRWCIVEQPTFVEIGRSDFQSDELSFFYTAQECLEAVGEVDVLLISGVLQALEQPHEMLDELVSLGIPHIIIDRTSFMLTGTRDRLAIQKVAPSIYPASFPNWFFNQPAFLKHFEPDYQIIATFNALDQANIEDSHYQGFIFQRR